MPTQRTTPASANPPAVSRRGLGGHVWAGLGMILLGGMGLAGMRAVTAAGSVAMLDASDRLLAGGDHAIRLARTAQFGDDPAQSLQVFLPTDRAHNPAVTGRALPIVVFIHGGGWVSGHAPDYRFIARTLAPTGYAVVLAGYRLQSDGRYPAMLQDGAAAVRWLSEHAAELGGDPGRIVLMGHSAGAYNAVMLGLDRRWQDLAGVPAGAVCGVIGLAGPYDFLPLDDASTIGAFGHVEHLPETQPIHHVRGDAPPMLLLHGNADQRVRVRHSLALARAMAGCGARIETHVIDGITHEGLIMRFARPFMRDQRPIAHITEFLARVTATDASGTVQASGV